MSEQTTHGDLHRDIGRMEGEFIGMKSDISDIKTIVERLDKRMARIEARESELRGAWWVLAGIAGVVGGLIVIVVHLVGGHVWK